MANLVLVLVCLLVGILLQKVKQLPRDAHVVLNVVILHVPLPAIALLSIPNLEWDPALVSLCFVPWILFLFSYLIFRTLGSYLRWEASVVGCLILTAGLGNTAFVGFPVIEALFGREALKLAILLDQPGTFLIVSSLGIWIAVLHSSGRMRKRELARRIFLFPPFVAFLLSIVLGVSGWKAQGDVKTILEKLAAVLTPLALISVGLQLRFGELRDEAKFLSLGLGYKLLVAPLLIFTLYAYLEISPLMYKIAVMEAAMAPMITASILAASHGLAPRLAGLMVGVGVPLSFLTLPLWHALLEAGN